MASQLVALSPSDAENINFYLSRITINKSSNSQNVLKNKGGTTTARSSSVKYRYCHRETMHPFMAGNNIKHRFVVLLYVAYNKKIVFFAERWAAITLPCKGSNTMQGIEPRLLITRSHSIFVMILLSPDYCKTRGPVIPVTYNVECVWEGGWGGFVVFSFTSPNLIIFFAEWGAAITLPCQGI